MQVSSFRLLIDHKSTYSPSGRSSAAVNWKRQFPDRFQNLLHRRPIHLVLASVDVADRSAAIDDQRGRMRDIDGVLSQAVIQPVRLGRRAVFIQQKRK